MWESFTCTTIIVNMVTANITSKIITLNDVSHLLEYWGVLASNLILFLLITVISLGFEKQ